MKETKKVAPTAPTKDEGSTAAPAVLDTLKDKFVGTKLEAPIVSRELSSQISAILRIAVLGLIMFGSFSMRQFSVLRFESVIHEFDPWFNYRATMNIVENGALNFHNWFDPRAWYPLGRIVGGTVYPGLMWTSAIIYHVLHFFNITIDIRNVCVMLAPLFAAFTSLTAYFFGKEIKGEGTGLLAAAFMGVVPGYVSRSVAGSYDNEGIAIFALVMTYFLWVKSVKTGSILWATMCALSYYYMVAAWGAYVFIINLLPLHVLVLLVSGRYSERLYVAYSVFYTLGTLLSMQITFVGFHPVQSSEHMAAAGMFVVLQVFAFLVWVRSNLSPEKWRLFWRSAVVGVCGLGLIVGIVGIATGYISPFTGRFYALLDPTYAKDHIPIIASVSEHQPTTWASFFFDLHILVFLFPAGIYFCFKNLNDGTLFVILYSVTAIYFSGVMVRLILILAPIACVMGAIAVSSILEMFFANVKDAVLENRKAEEKKKQAVQQKSKVSKAKPKKDLFPAKQEVSLVMAFGMLLLLVIFVFHCTWVTSEAYSSPSIVLAAKQRDGHRMIFDDFREGYKWLRSNTPEDARIMSWWDYGYQISGMANRTVIVDNNTWNNSHIAEVGHAFSVPEEDAIHIIRKLDVDYILVIFGGMTGYASDDINKFLWMVRIAGSTDASIIESDYYSAAGEFRIDSGGSPAMLNCLMYKCCYYRFGEVPTQERTDQEGKYISGFDRVRNVEIGNKDLRLHYIEEAYTSEHWIVRIYRVLPPSNTGDDPVRF